MCGSVTGERVWTETARDEGRICIAKSVNSVSFGSTSILVIKIPSFLTLLCNNFLCCSNVDKLLYFFRHVRKIAKSNY
jgi:hypothetical protein